MKYRFRDNFKQKVVIIGNREKLTLQLVTTTKLLKGYHEKQMIYAVKLNPIDKQKDLGEPEWLLEYEYIFPKKLTELPPPREVDHTIELVLGAQLVAKDHTRCPYPK